MRKARHTPGGVSVTVKGKNIPITTALHDQVVHKMVKMDKYLDHLQTIEVELGTEKTREIGQHNHVEATTHIKGRTIRVSATNGDMYAAIDEAVDKLYRQLNRHKERMKAHHASRLAEALPANTDAGVASVPGAVDSDAADQREPAIRVERFEMEPQFEDEAVEELEAKGRDFYVFLNARNEQVNVLYRRPDGDYGLIEPNVR